MLVYNIAFHSSHTSPVSSNHSQFFCSIVFDLFVQNIVKMDLCTFTIELCKKFASILGKWKCYNINAETEMLLELVSRV